MFPRRPARAPGGTGDMISLSAGLSLWLPLYVWIHLCVFTGRLGEEVRVYHFLVVVIGSQCVNPCLFEQLEYLSCSWTCNIFLKYEWGCFVCFPCTNFYTSSLCVPQASCGGARGNRSQVIMQGLSIYYLWLFEYIKTPFHLFMYVRCLYLSSFVVSYFQIFMLYCWHRVSLVTHWCGGKRNCRACIFSQGFPPQLPGAPQPV